ncbi:MAG: hypothetical protein IKN50_07165 [Clostridia bacterium]|nr:hypothetical protein [Thermoguttaceae bacterium]MBR3640369.1 hypothetical protein [Clostridia bacterium]
MICLRGKRKIKAVLIFLVLSGIQVAIYGGETEEKLLRALKSGIDEQLREVEFKCAYTFSSYVVDTIEEAKTLTRQKADLLFMPQGFSQKLGR